MSLLVFYAFSSSLYSNHPKLGIVCECSVFFHTSGSWHTVFPDLDSHIFPIYSSNSSFFEAQIRHQILPPGSLHSLPPILLSWSTSCSFLSLNVLLLAPSKFLPIRTCAFYSTLATCSTRLRTPEALNECLLSKELQATV